MMEDDGFDVFEDDMDILEILDFGFPRKVYDRTNPYETLDDLTFFKRFRLYKETVDFVLSLIEEELEYPNDVNNSVSPINQLLIALRFLGTGSHHSLIADVSGAHRTTVNRITNRVIRVIARQAANIIKMPSAQEVVHKQSLFYDVAKFPRVIGIVDGTHVKIKSPGGEDAEVFRNRKGYFSLNVQVTCDAELRFQDIVARWPGSTHDMTVFLNSNLRGRFENGEFPNSFLLGDSGYALRNFFLTPLAVPFTQPEKNYNTAFNTTRNMIERTIGVWKRRFPCLAYGFRAKLENVLPAIVASAVLHNIARDMNEPDPPTPEILNIEELNYLIAAGNINIPEEHLNIQGNITQRNLINTYFANL